jgi:hypothetical protein
MSIVIAVLTIVYFKKIRKGIGYIDMIITNSMHSNEEQLYRFCIHSTCIHTKGLFRLDYLFIYHLIFILREGGGVCSIALCNSIFVSVNYNSVFFLSFCLMSSQLMNKGIHHNNCNNITHISQLIH